jgi:ABC-2 type transport system permease protein
MGRYGRCLRRYWATSLAVEAEYRLNLLLEVLSVAGNLAGSLLLLTLFTDHGHSLGGWSWPAALVVLGVHTLLDGLSTSLLQPNLSTIVRHVQTGTLDYLLLQPLDSQFQVSLRVLSPWGLPAAMAGLGLIVTGLVQAGAAPGPAALALAALLLLAASLILYSLWFLLAATSIWFVKVWNATEVLRSLLVAGRYPVSAYPPALRTLLTVVLPVAFLTTVPASALLGRVSIGSTLAALAFAGCGLLASRLFWRFALRHYTSASS